MTQISLVEKSPTDNLVRFDLVGQYAAWFRGLFLAKD